MKKKNDHGVFAAVRMAAASHRLLTVGTVLCVAASVAASLLPPLLLARVIDRLTAGLPLSFLAVLLYFGSLALEGVLTSAQESLLVLFGQRMTHALRSEMSRKLSRLPAGTLAEQNPGEVAARFSGDVDTVEALFTSGIISMAADACRIVSIMGVIAVKNTGLALILLLVLPLFAVFTRYVQKRMLAAQLDNRRAVAAVSGQVPETLHNIRTIRALGLEDYMERRYDRCIGDSYAAMERTNFYDAVYSPVVLVLNAAVVGIVMLLSASGNATASDPVRHVGGHLGGRHQLHLPHLCPHRKPGHGDPDHPVCHGGCQAHRCLSRPAGAHDPSRAQGGCPGRCGTLRTSPSAMGNGTF